MHAKTALRRRMIKSALAAIALNGVAPSLMVRTASAAAASTNSDRILVVVELSGGNDGLNTVIPYGDDNYYRLRPTIGIPAKDVRKIDEYFGFNPGLNGFERLWKDGKLAAIHGCGYENPSYSHFTSMAYWHSGMPNGGDEHGWVGRLADQLSSVRTPNFIINVDSSQSYAVRGRIHTPVVFDDPDRFLRLGFAHERALLERVTSNGSDTPNRKYLSEVAASAREASFLVRDAWRNYKSPVDYGLNPIGLNKVAACIAHGFPTRIYYVSYRNNAFDTHVHQVDVHQRLLTYTSDAIQGFLRDMERVGQANRVAILAFSEFGRRPKENSSLGTDHGTANVVFLAGEAVKGGHYGVSPPLSDLDAGGNLKYTSDFRRAYATVIDGWLTTGASRDVLKGTYEPYDAFL